MKRWFVILFLLFPLVSFSQKFNGGILAGGLVSQVDGDTYEGYHKFGFLAGGFVKLQVSPHSSFQLEMEYIQKGSRVHADSITNTGITRITRLHYLEIPLLYQYTFLKRVQAEVGPAADILLGSYEEVNGIEVPYITVPYRTVTLSGIIGVSCYITDHLKAGLRFNYSLLSIRTDVVAGARKILFETGQYNNVLSLSLSWDFRARTGGRGD
ncbi:MAG TPA: porin family protein [Bacteroidales bacterium]|nr:porin family protein [Bacteroidales bacterium]HPS51581.1 porin family protein [Bacteroidales bacterium]